MAACLLCYVTDRKAFPGSELARQRALLKKISEAARCGVDYIQLREKDLSAGELEALAREAVRIVRQSLQGNSRSGPPTRLLINSRTDVALATAADGVHLRSDDISAEEARRVWKKGEGNARMTIGVSCHSTVEVEQAEIQGADFAAFAPVFEKQGAPGAQLTGLNPLRQSCRHKIPVLALGGVTFDNAAACFESGATGIAAIRLFQENEIAEVVRRLRDR